MSVFMHSWAQICDKRNPLGTKLSIIWSELGPTWANLEATWAQLEVILGANFGATRGQPGPTWANFGPTLSNLMPTWGQDRTNLS